MMGRKIFGIFVLLSLCACGKIADGPPNRIPWKTATGDTVAPAGFPEIGKWMLDPGKQPAHWLGEQYEGRSLREPINLIIVDSLSKSADEAGRRLMSGFTEAGFPAREGHSGGYWGYIAGFLYGQLPEGGNLAFSDEPFELGNNHGRLFGPHPFRNGWIFIGAVSREKVDLLDKVKHRYVSFNRARDEFSRRLDLKTDYKISSFVNLGNAIVGDAALSTGDHDAIAVLLRTVSPGPDKGK